MGRSSIVLLTTSLLLMTLLSGCTFSNGTDGQSAGGPGSLSYNGASNGSHASEAISCGAKGKVNINYNMGGGSLTVTVRDGAGRSIFHEEYSGTGQRSETKDLSGTAGDWVVTVQRGGSGSIPGYGGYGTQQYGGGFSGQYNVNIAC